ARRVIADMAAEEDGLLRRRSAASRAAVRRTIASSALGTAVALALLLAVYRLKRREDEERERTAEATRRGEVWLHTTLESIGDAVIATDERGLIRVINPVARKLTGWGADAAGRP